ncbi:PREDICTED: uncharacterized protein At2g39910 isoform X1 [Ipomoea nil]|uniref:uncharacterized protein At2g39910 isoform X1 n=1 Tax=Ipomoea nil TaxID=35883 RepID=UPI0009017102|nr:PREDICTED: uncharacterized protein At2g39910 isoform X1 [Ipomoea nil]
MKRSLNGSSNVEASLSSPLSVSSISPLAFSLITLIQSSTPCIHARLSERIGDFLSPATYTPPEGSNVNIKSTLESLLPRRSSPLDSEISDVETKAKISDFVLCCAALAAASESTYSELLWVPNSLSVAAVTAFRELAEAYSSCFGATESMKVGEFEFDLKFMPNDVRLLVELMPRVLPSLKDRIKESAIDKSIDTDEFSAASARTPVAYAIVAAHQFKWFVTQVNYPYLGKVCSLVIPCGLTALDHWSQQVKGQGMISFIHLSKNVNAAEISWFDEVILDACCQNIASSDDEIWQYVVEMSVLMVTSTQKSNPRSIWYEKLLNEMLSHLERQPKNKERRIAWLKHIEPLFNGVGLVLLSHFRRLFPLFFRWMHANDDDTVLLVLERIKTVLRLTWIRNSPYTERLVDELVALYKEAAMRTAREDIRSLIIQILTLMHQSKGSQFEAAWDKHKTDPDLTAFHHSFTGRHNGMAAVQ